MKLVLISDFHLLWENPVGRLDNLAETQFLKLNYILEYAKKNNALILQAGDFFDKPRSWHLLPKVTETIREYGIKIFSIFGQHDTYLYSHETRSSTNLGELAAAGLVYILDNTQYIIEHPDLNGKPVHLYGVSHGTELSESVEDPGAFNILVIHKSIGHRGNEFGATSSAKRFLKNNPDFKLILCGDIHQRFHIKIGDRHIINTGAILRRTAREYNFTHVPMFYVCEIIDNSVKGKWITIPHQPPDEILSRDHIEELLDENETLEEFTYEIERLSSNGANVANILLGLIREYQVNKRVKNIIMEITNADYRN